MCRFKHGNRTIGYMVPCSVKPPTLLTGSKTVVTGIEHWERERVQDVSRLDCDAVVVFKLWDR
jgi:hypothetical protein